MGWESLKSCTLCGKPIEEVLVLTEVSMGIHSRYHREDGVFENMNGLQKNTREYFCEACLQAFVEKIEVFAAERKKAAPVQSPETAE
jgi:hypothetical protein